MSPDSSFLILAPQPCNSIAWQDNLLNPLCRPLAVLIDLMRRMPTEYKDFLEAFKEMYDHPNSGTLKRGHYSQIRRVYCLFQNPADKEPEVLEKALTGSDCTPFTTYFHGYLVSHPESRLREMAEAGMHNAYYQLRYQVPGKYRNLQDNFYSFIKACGLACPNGGDLKALPPEEVIARKAAFEKIDFTKPKDDSVQKAQEAFALDFQDLLVLPKQSLAGRIVNELMTACLGTPNKEKALFDTDYTVTDQADNADSAVVEQALAYVKDHILGSNTDIATIDVAPHVFFAITSEDTFVPLLLSHWTNNQSSAYPSLAGYGQILVRTRLKTRILNDKESNYVCRIQADKHMIYIHNLSTGPNMIQEYATNNIVVSFEGVKTSASNSDMPLSGGCVSYSLKLEMLSYLRPILTEVSLATSADSPEPACSITAPVQDVNLSN